MKRKASYQSSSSSEISAGLKDDSDFWNEQVVDENFNEKVSTLFAGGVGGRICGFDRDIIFSVIESLPAEYQESLQATLE